MSVCRADLLGDPPSRTVTSYLPHVKSDAGAAINNSDQKLFSAGEDDGPSEFFQTTGIVRNESS